MDFITKRAISKARHLIKKGLDPKNAIEVSISCYIGNPKLNIKQLIDTVKKEIKQEFYYEDNDLC